MFEKKSVIMKTVSHQSEIIKPKFSKRERHSTLVHSSGSGIFNYDIQIDDIDMIEKNSNIHLEEVSPIKRKNEKCKKYNNKDPVENYSPISNIEAEDPSETNMNDKVVLNNELNIQNLNVGKERNRNTIFCHSEINPKISKRMEHSTSIHISDLGLFNSDIQSDDTAAIGENSNIHLEDIYLFKHKNKKYKNKDLVEKYPTGSNMQTADSSEMNVNDKIVLSSELNVPYSNARKEKKANHIYNISCHSEIINPINSKRKKHSTSIYSSDLGLFNSDSQIDVVAAIEKNSNIHLEEVFPFKRKNKKHKKCKNKDLVEKYPSASNMQTEDSSEMNVNEKNVLNSELNVPNSNVGKVKKGIHIYTISCHSEINNPIKSKRRKHSTSIHSSDLGLFNSDIQSDDTAAIEENSNIHLEDIYPLKHKNKKYKKKDLVEKYPTGSNMQTGDSSEININDKKNLNSELNVPNSNVRKEKKGSHIYNISCHSEIINPINSKRKKHSPSIYSSDLGLLNSDSQIDGAAAIEKNSNIHLEEVFPFKHKNKKHKKCKNKDIVEKYPSGSNMQTGDLSEMNANEIFCLNSEFNAPNSNVGKEKKGSHIYTISCHSEINNPINSKRKKHSASIHSSDLGLFNSDIQSGDTAAIYKNYNIHEKYSTISNMQAEDPREINANDKIVLNNELSIQNLNFRKGSKHNHVNTISRPHSKINVPVNNKRKHHSSYHASEIGIFNSDIQFDDTGASEKNSNIYLEEVFPVEHKKMKYKNKDLVEKYSALSTMESEDLGKTGANNEVILSNKLNTQNLNVGKERGFNQEACSIPCNLEIVDNLQMNKRKRHSKAIQILDSDISNFCESQNNITIIEKKSDIRSAEIPLIKHKNKKNKSLVKDYSFSKLEDSSIANTNDQFILNNNLNIKNLNVADGNGKFNHKAYAVSCNSEVDNSVGNNLLSGTFNFNDDLEPLDFEVPPLHEYETVCALSVHQRQKLFSQGVTIKTGKFTHDEDEIIINNFREFACKYGISDPYQLLGIGRYEIDRKFLKFLKAKHFYVRLGKGLNDRSLSSIYKRARLILHPSRLVDKAERKNVASIQHLRTCIGKKWTMIGDKVGRSAESCAETYRWHEGALSKGHWTADEEKCLIKAIQKVTGYSDVSCDKIQNISWEQVAAHVPTRNFSQCRWYWANHLAWKSSSLKLNWNRACYVKLIEILSKDFNEEHVSSIDWEKIHKHFEDVSPSYMHLQKRWLSLKFQIPGHKTKSYKDIIRELCQKYKVA